MFKLNWPNLFSERELTFTFAICSDVRIGLGLRPQNVGLGLEGCGLGLGFEALVLTSDHIVVIVKLLRTVAYVMVVK